MNMDDIFSQFGDFSAVPLVVVADWRQGQRRTKGSLRIKVKLIEEVANVEKSKSKEKFKRPVYLTRLLLVMGKDK
jgi:hypothetical protein